MEIPEGDIGPNKYAPKGYPWADWFNGSLWVVERGVDFPGTITAETFRKQVLTKARRWGLLVRTSNVGDHPTQVKIQRVHVYKGVNIRRPEYIQNMLDTHVDTTEHE